MINIQQEIQNNEVLKEVQALLVSQTQKGIVKYGKTVTTNALTVEEWLRHVQEEMTDTLVYSTVIKQIVSDLKNQNEQLINENRKLANEKLLYERALLAALNESTDECIDLADDIVDVLLNGRLSEQMEKQALDGAVYLSQFVEDEE